MDIWRLMPNKKLSYTNEGEKDIANAKKDISSLITMLHSGARNCFHPDNFRTKNVKEEVKLTEVEKSAYSRILRGTAIVVLISLVSFSFVVLVESGTETTLNTVQPEGLSPELRDYLSPPSREEPDPFTLIDISDEDFAAAEIAVSIEYNLLGQNLADYSDLIILAKGAHLTAGLKITVGVEETAQVTGKTPGLSLQSLTGLRTVAARRDNTLWNASLLNRMTAQQARRTELGVSSIAASTVTTVVARVQELGFAKEDLLIRPDERHWFVRIQDFNVAPPKTPGAEYERPCACLQSFNITIGDIRYSSLVHPVFAAGWDVTADIAGRPCEIFQKVKKSAEAEQGLGLLGQGRQYDEYWYQVEQTYGIAGVIGVAYFESQPDLPGILDAARAVRDFLKRTGIWEIYYMETTDPDGSDYIDDGDMEWLLDSCVDDRLGTPGRCDNVFWYIESHGSHSGNSGYVLSSFDNNELWEEELATQERKITDDAYLFYWAGSCDSYYLDTLWQSWGSAYHQWRAIVWYYQVFAYADKIEEDREMWSFIQHAEIARLSVQDMFDDTGAYPTYWLTTNSDPWTEKEVKWVKDAFEDAHPTDDMWQGATTNREFFFVTPEWDWTKATDSPSARTPGEPCYEDSSEDDWGWSVQYYFYHTFEAYETYPGTYCRYVGFYTRIKVGAVWSYAENRRIWIAFDGRATSNYAGSSVTNLWVAIYSADWQTLIGDPWPAIINPGVGKDSGWRFCSHVFDLGDSGTDEEFNVLIFYSDGWSYCWYQHIYFQNIALNWYRRI